MTEYQLIFEGNLRLFIEGNNALLPFKQNSQDEKGFYIGSENTNLIIRDHRSGLMDEQIPFHETDISHFIRAFQQPAWAEVKYCENDENMEIELFESNVDGELPILWFGVLEDNIMPGYKVEWEVFKALTEDRTAFAALIP